MRSPVNELHKEAVMVDRPNAFALGCTRYDAEQLEAVIAPSIQLNHNEAFPSAPNSIPRWSIVKRQIGIIAGQPTPPGAPARDKRTSENSMKQRHWKGILLLSALCLGGSQACAQAPGAAQLR